MFYNEQSEDYRPLFWISGRPIYAYTLLILLHLAGFILAAFAMSYFGPDAVRQALEFQSVSIYHGWELWRLASYNIFLPSYWAIWFIVALGFLYFAGQQVEQFVGFKVFLKLYAALVILPALVLLLIGTVWPQSYLSGLTSIYGVFVAFATIYPGVMLNFWFVNLTAKGWAWTLAIVYSLADLAIHDWTGLMVLWMCGLIGYAGMRLVGAGRGMTWLTDWLENRQAARLARQHNIRVLKDARETQSIDSILEKISKQGVGSLSSQEKAALERARTNLLKRDKR